MFEQKFQLKLKRYVIVVITMVGLGFVWNYLSREKPWEINLPVRRENIPDIILKDIVSSEVSGERVYWKMKSVQAVMRGENIEFQSVSGNFFDMKNRNVFDFVTPRILSKKDTTIFYGLSGISRDKMRLKTPIAFWFGKQRYLYSPRKTIIYGKGLILTGNKFFMFPDKNIITLSENVILNNNERSVTVNSDNCDITGEDIVFINNITIISEELRATPNSLRWIKRNKKIDIRGGVTINYHQNIITADKAYFVSNGDDLFLEGNVAVRKGSTLLKGKEAILNRVTNKLFIEGQVVGTHGENQIDAPKVEYDLETKQLKTAGRSRLMRVTSN